MTWVLRLFGFALSVAYVPGIKGAASSPRWAVLVIGAAVLMFFVIRTEVDKIQHGGEPGARLSWPHLFGGLFLGWAFVAWSWSSAPEAYDAGWKLTAVALLFMVGAKLPTLAPVYEGAAVGLLLNGLLVIADRLGLVDYQQHGAPSGLFVNGLYLAEFAAMVVVGLAARGRWWLMAICLPSVLLVSLPRGPLVALGLAMLVLLIQARMPRMFWMAVGLMLVAVPVLIMVRPFSIVDRFEMWAALLPQVNLVGHGLGSYFGDAPAMLGRSEHRPLHPNNDLLEIAYEMGVIGFLLAAAFVISLLRCWWQHPEWLVVVVFIVEGCFGFPFHLPWTVGLFALAAGQLAGDCGAGSNHAVSCGNTVCAGDGGAGGTGFAVQSDAGR